MTIRDRIWHAVRDWFGMETDVRELYRRVSQLQHEVESLKSIQIKGPQVVELPELKPTSDVEAYAKELRTRWEEFERLSWQAPSTVAIDIYQEASLVNNDYVWKLGIMVKV